MSNMNNDQHKIDALNKELANYPADKIESKILEFVSQAPNNITLIPKIYQSKKEIVLRALSSGCSFELIHHSFKNQQEMVLFASKQTNNSNAISFASEELQNDQAFILTLLKTNGLVYEHISEFFKNNKEMAMAAVSKRPMAYEFLPPQLKVDPELVFLAISRDIQTWHFIPENLRKKELLLLSLSKNGMGLKHLSEEMKDDIDLVIVAIKNSASAIKFASERLQQNRDILLTLKHECSYIKEEWFFQKMRFLEVLLEQEYMENHNPISSSKNTIKPIKF